MLAFRFHTTRDGSLVKLKSHGKEDWLLLEVWRIRDRVRSSNPRVFKSHRPTKFDWMRIEEGAFKLDWETLSIRSVVVDGNQTIFKIRAERIIWSPTSPKRCWNFGSLAPPHSRQLSEPMLNQRAGDQNLAAAGEPSGSLICSFHFQK